jgi:hypothetical protein
VITFPLLGQLGRLGNQLFQIAATVAHALSHHTSFRFPRWEYEGLFPIEGCFQDHLTWKLPYKEPHFHYSPIPQSSSLALEGFFQSERYFSACSARIRNLLTPGTVMDQPFRSRTASVHVRRTDYAMNPLRHPPLEMAYYEEAAQRLAGMVDFFYVISDDPAWCKERFRKPKFHVMPPAPDVVDLSKMISCEHHIIANSSFSWWGAWLDPRPHKTVIAPRQWFGPELAHYDTKDLIPSGWLLI